MARLLYIRTSFKFSSGNFSSITPRKNYSHATSSHSMICKHLCWMCFVILLLLLDLILLALALPLIPLISDVARITLLALSLTLAHLVSVLTRLFIFVFSLSLACMTLSFSLYGSLFLLLFWLFLHPF